MNLTQLKAFHAVAKSGSFTRAAERLCISQPAVTASISALEERHGVPLFHRRGRKISLTHAGDHLLGIAERLFALEEEAADYLEGAQDLKTGKLRLAIGSPYGIAPLLKRFRKRYPGIEIQLLPGNFQNVEEMLLAEQADLAIQTEAPEMDGITRLPFQQHQLIAFCHRDDPMAAQNGPINLWQLEQATLILREKGSVTRRLFEEATKQHDFTPHSVIEAGSRETVEELVRQRLGIGIVLSGELPEDDILHPLPLVEPKQEITDYLLYLDRRHALSLLRAFLDLVQ
ncbi:LysR substrate-binding domain-containing protein [Aestuariispira insulae]|uniref:Aminoethylphosphonate catabolism LysR family transcriptional regulator n=1 Tax=Aestuariispira insulae TaxID=1461337 RepID=A0A3D9HSR4_9PROT|nr:LysR substrate-binding domain-containing protein [Aestuariispira insulae]RED52489.1 aminoethylphosphonate catabolism LysR family transcriptional regulator [Aestuariispira insulae]